MLITRSGAITWRDLADGGPGARVSGDMPEVVVEHRDAEFDDDGLTATGGGWFAGSAEDCAEREIVIGRRRCCTSRPVIIRLRIGETRSRTCRRIAYQVEWTCRLGDGLEDWRESAMSAPWRCKEANL